LDDLALARQELLTAPLNHELRAVHVHLARRPDCRRQHARPVAAARDHIERSHPVLYPEELEDLDWLVVLVARLVLRGAVGRCERLAYPRLLILRLDGGRAAEREHGQRQPTSLDESHK